MTHFILQIKTSMYDVKMDKIFSYWCLKKDFMFVSVKSCIGSWKQSTVLTFQLVSIPEHRHDLDGVSMKECHRTVR